MTREEAIREIKNMAKFNYTLAPTEVFDMAIKALEQELCEDAISRQAVLDLCDSKDPEYKVEHLKEDVECLPPVTLQPETGHWYRKHSWEICFTCSNCETTNASGTKYNYCPSCGSYNGGD